MRAAGGEVQTVVALDIAHGHVGAGLAQRPEQHPVAGGRDEVVAIDEGEMILGDVGKAQIAGPARAAAGTRHDEPAGMGGGVTVADLAGGIGRAVVDQDHLRRRLLLGE